MERRRCGSELRLEGTVVLFTDVDTTGRDTGLGKGRNSEFGFGHDGVQVPMRKPSGFCQYSVV